MGEHDIQMAVAKAIERAWDEIKDVPFPFYASEKMALAVAAIAAYRGTQDPTNGE